MDEDDDAFLYGESSPPPVAAPEVAQTPEVTKAVQPEVTPTRSSFPLSLALNLMFSRCCPEPRFRIICCYGCVSFRLS